MRGNFLSLYTVEQEKPKGATSSARRPLFPVKCLDLSQSQVFITLQAGVYSRLHRQRERPGPPPYFITLIKTVPGVFSSFIRSSTITYKIIKTHSRVNPLNYAARPPRQGEEDCCEHRRTMAFHDTVGHTRAQALQAAATCRSLLAGA